MRGGHRDLVVALAQHHAWRRGAELGLARGLLLRRLLEACPDLSMTGVDLCKHPHRAASLTAIELEYGERCKILRGSTNDMAEHVKGEFDFVFIDAGHGYQAVKDDIANYKWKVRKNGWLMGHDYDPARHPGVVNAVREAFGHDVVLLPHTIWVWDRGIATKYVELIQKAFA